MSSTPIPLLRGPLEETLGVILYQDQVLQVAMAVAGYTAGEADLLRRAMSRRRSYEALHDHWPRFLKGGAGRAASPILPPKQSSTAYLGSPPSVFPRVMRSLSRCSPMSRRGCVTITRRSTTRHC
ncbi:MAG: hypothetical protein KatS3mg060_3074 [Dehalococcoidia bacterium]|nr:MAG: hypothetical protein KatS3mg060_3074 [Dehalococcoidia bacterium]